MRRLLMSIVATVKADMIHQEVEIYKRKQVRKEKENDQEKKKVC